MHLVSRGAQVAGFRTKDGSLIRELMHPAAHGNAALSLAEATLPPGGVAVLHLHPRTEETYHVLEGSMRLTRGDEELALGPGDTACIPPGTPHRARNDGPGPLRFLCACAPAYSHEDTVLLEPAPEGS